MLRIIKVKKETNTLGLRVAALVDSLKECQSLTTFETCFKGELKGIKTGNDKKADVQYRTRLEHVFTANERLNIIKDHYKNGEQIIFIITK